MQSARMSHIFASQRTLNYTQHLRQRVQQGQTRLRCWSAACSSGEEAYTLAMVAADCLDLTKLDFRILATDINTEVLQRCRQAVYSDKNTKRTRHSDNDFPRSTTIRRDGKSFRLAHTVTVRRLNLAQPPFPMRGPFDLIFCRNVMIYFDNSVHSRLLQEMSRLLAPAAC